MNNHVEINMAGISENVSFARMAVAAFIAPADPSVDEVSDIKTAVSEAVTNAIIHGYGQTPGNVKMAMTMDGETLTVQVCDEGVGIHDIEEARQPLFTTKGELERSGLGFTVMESFMDSVVVESVPKKGTKIILTKALKPQG